MKFVSECVIGCYSLCTHQILGSWWSPGKKRPGKTKFPTVVSIFCWVHHIRKLDGKSPLFRSFLSKKYIIMENPPLVSLLLKTRGGFPSSFL